MLFQDSPTVPRRCLTSSSKNSSDHAAAKMRAKYLMRGHSMRDCSEVLALGEDGLRAPLNLSFTQTPGRICRLFIQVFQFETELLSDEFRAEFWV